MAYAIQIVPSALEELRFLKSFYKRQIVAAIDEHLQHEPTTATCDIRGYSMTTVNLHDFTLHPDKYLAATSAGDVVVTQDGEPWVVLRAVEDDQDRVSAAYANSAKFHELINERRQEKPIPWDEAKKQLDLGK